MCNKLYWPLSSTLWNSDAGQVTIHPLFSARVTSPSTEEHMPASHLLPQRSTCQQPLPVFLCKLWPYFLLPMLWHPKFLLGRGYEMPHWISKEELKIKITQINIYSSKNKQKTTTKTLSGPRPITSEFPEHSTQYMLKYVHIIESYIIGG